MPTPTITVIGSLNTDLITRTPRLPLPGETLSATSFSTGCGGKGCNQAVACARLSSSSSSRPSPPGSSSVPAPSAPPPLPITIRMVGAVGDDEFGGTLLQGLKRNGVDASGVSVVSRQRTGVAVIVVEEATGENRILLSEGANGCVTPASLQQAWLSSSSSGSEDQDENKPALVVLQLEIPLSTVVHVVQRARQRGVPVLLNPAPAPAQEMQREVYAGLEHLILNETEARTLSSSSSSSPPPSSPPHDDHNRTDTNNDDATAFMSATATHFHTLGVATVILTLGARGVFFSTEAADSGFVPAEKVDDVVDTTAAGDTFVGAYAVAVTEGWGVREAVGWANRAAGVSVRREGAMEAIPWRGEVGEVGVGE